jgi:hypothetical protein
MTLEKDTGKTKGLKSQPCDETTHQFSLLPVFINKTLLEHRNTYLHILVSAFILQDLSNSDRDHIAPQN